MPWKLIDLTGSRFGRWTVVSRATNSDTGRVRWNSICECGEQKAVFASALRGGGSTSCGCYQREWCSARRTKEWAEGLRRDGKRKSANVVEALADIDHFEDGAQLRRIGGEMLLALARKELPAADIDAGAKMIAALSMNWATQLRKEAQAEQMRSNLRLIGKRPEEE